MLVQIACDAILNQAVERSAFFMRSRPGALARPGRPHDSDLRQPYPNAMRFEAYLGIAIVRNLKAADIRQLAEDSPAQSNSMPNVPLVRSGLPSGQVERAWATVHMELWTKVAKILASYPQDPDRASKELKAMSDQVGQDRGVTNLLRDQSCFPVYESRQSEAVVRGSKLISARFWRYFRQWKSRPRTGKFPTSLSAIPGTWIDPFTNSPLKYKLTSKGVRVYSVGPTLVDHGGIAQTEAPKDSKDYDIVASCPPVGPRKK